MAIIYSYPLADEVTNDSWVLGSEMDNGSRVVKNYSVGDLASFTRGFVTLNDVLDNDNVSQLNAKVGGIFLYNSHLPSGLGYPYITGDKNRFNFYNNVDEYYGNLSQDTLSLANVGDEYYLSIMKPVAVTENRTVTFQDADGTVALTDDLLNYVPYTGATGSINIGSNDIYTAGGAKLADDGTVYGTELLLYDGPNLGYAAISIADDYFVIRRSNGDEMVTCNNGSLLSLKNSTNGTAIIGNPLTTQRFYTLPDADGTVALTDDLLDYVPYTGATQSIDIGNYDIYTAGNARLGDDGTVWGSSFQFPNTGSLQSVGDNVTWILPDENGTIALTGDLPQVSDDFANDTAAAAGGIAVGGLYHNNGVVRIRLV
jgi:hypothetical protein